MRRIFVICFTAFLASTINLAPADALSNYSSFADVPFGTQRSPVHEYLEARGFSFVPNNFRTNEEEYRGIVDGELGYIYATYDENGGLSEISVSFLSVASSAKARLKKLCRTLRTKYGSPDHGNCGDYTFWLQPNGSSKMEVGYYETGGDDFVMVGVHYQGPTYRSTKSNL